MAKALTVVFENGFDWALLRDQKSVLLTLTEKTDTAQTSALDGVINLLDHIQDSAEAQGFPVLWIDDEYVDACEKMEDRRANP